MTGRAWLSLIGVGEDGLDGLSPAARAALAQAPFVVGGARHLSLCAAAITGETLAWPSPMADGIAAILSRRGQRVCVLASGDPFHYGVGVTLAQHVPAAEMAVHPHPSAFSLMASRLGWGQQDCTLLSLHGRPLERLIPALQPRSRILALSWDGGTPAAAARLMTARGFGAARVVVGEALGGPRERITASTAAALGEATFDPLNIIAIETGPVLATHALPLVPGLPDALFENDGPLTKRPIRAMTLSALAPRAGEVLWDVGAGTGSISIEWMLAHPANRAIAIERRPDRAERIRRNARALGVPDLTVVEGGAPEALTGLAAPDAIFLGGGVGGSDLIATALHALRPGGRLVANAVTLETQAVLMAAHADHGGELMTVAVALASPVGPMTGWRPAMPLMHWVHVVGEDAP